MEFDDPYETRPEEQGVLKRHAKPQEVKPSRKPPVADQSEGSDAEQYAELEDYFRQKFAQEADAPKPKTKAQNMKATTKASSAPRKPRAQPSAGADYREMATMYKTLLDQTLQGIKQHQAPAKKPLTDKQIARNEKARQQMLAYHAKKKENRTPTKSVEPNAEPTAEPKPKPKTEAKDTPLTPPAPTTRNFFADLAKRRRR